MRSREEKEFGGLDILVNNVGIFPRATFEATTLEFWDEVQEVNVRGAYLCCQAATELMRKRGGGSIIKEGSTHAFTEAADVAWHHMRWQDDFLDKSLRAVELACRLDDPYAQH